LSTDPKAVQAARLLLTQLGLTPEDLMWAAGVCGSSRNRRRAKSGEDEES
jgi:hypothetical protein